MRTQIVYNMSTKKTKGAVMLERVKEELAKNKESLVPISLRVEASTKTALTILAASYDVKSNELVRIILKAFIEEAINEPLNRENIQKHSADNDDIGYDTLGELLDAIHPERDPLRRIIKQGFKVRIADGNLDDE